jgi:plastocyanin
LLVAHANSAIGIKSPPIWSPLDATVEVYYDESSRFCNQTYLLVVPLVLLANSAIAQSKSSKHACSELNPAQLWNASNTCGSASTPCEVDVKRTADGASSTPIIPGAKSNALFCVQAGTTVTWESTSKNIGFVVDPGTISPFEPGGAIIGGSDRTVSVVAKTAGCYKYSAGACMSGAIYGMCKETSAEVIVIRGN